MKPHFVKTPQIILLLGDFLILYGSLGLTLAIRYGAISRDNWLEHLLPFTIVYLIWLLVFYINDLYSYKLTRLEYLEKGGIAMMTNAAITVAFFYLVPQFGIAPRANLILNFALASILLALWRMMNDRFLRERLLKNVLFIGEAPEEQELYRYLEKRPQLGFLPRTTIKEVDLAQFIGNLNNFIDTNDVRVIVVSLNLNDYPELTSKLYAIMGRDILITNAINFYEETLSRIPLSVLNARWFLENIDEQGKRWYEFGKRGLDIAGASLGTVVLAGVLPLVALAIKLEDGGKTLFSQKRIGRLGKEFTIYKFRTMRAGAENNGPQFAKPNDDRATKVGRFLRKTRLDELPQFWNVLRGQMSFIGPRPERQEFVRELEQKFPFYNVRHWVKPGITGWAQIYYNYAASLEENLRKLQYDLFYIKNRSLLLDLMITLKTINIVFGRRGR